MQLLEDGGLLCDVREDLIQMIAAHVSTKCISSDYKIPVLP